VPPAAPLTPVPVAQRPIAVVTATPAATISSAQPAPAPAASVEPPNIHGVVILDNNGALGKPTPSLPAPPQESLGDAARRLKRAKQPEP
jgi:hypothetical protein